MRKNLIVIVTLLILAVAIVGVYLATIPKPIDETSLRSYSDPMTEQLLVSINTGNYTQFTANFDPAMLNAFPLEKFDQLRDSLQSNIGNFSSMSFLKAERSGSFIVAYYNTIYTNDSNVQVRVVFSYNDGIAKISGLWFNSEKLAS